MHTYVVKRGLDNCLTLYVLSEWEKLSQQLDEMRAFTPKVPKFKRLFLDGINLLEVDSAGRILIPKPLQEYAGLNKEIIFWAQGNKVEVWDKASKEAYIAAQQQEEEDLANELFN
ncbi:cell division protein MraZ [compost metagenome]